MNRKSFFYVRYKEECHIIASQSETKISELKQKIENLRERNEKLQSEIGDVKRKEAEVC
jgi:phosphoglycerate-specific signal transduction histidine kinase